MIKNIIKPINLNINIDNIDCFKENNFDVQILSEDIYENEIIQFIARFNNKNVKLNNIIYDSDILFIKNNKILAKKINEEKIINITFQYFNSSLNTLFEQTKSIHLKKSIFIVKILKHNLYLNETTTYVASLHGRSIINVTDETYLNKHPNIIAYNKNILLVKNANQLNDEENQLIFNYNNGHHLYTASDEITILHSVFEV